MDGIQALSSKAKPAATLGAAVNDDDTAAGAFAALLQRVGARVKAIDTGAALDSKLMRGEEDAKARVSADRDAAKTRNDKDDDRATAAKPKTNKTRDEDDSNQTKAASGEDTAEDTTDAAQTPEGQTAAQVAAQVTAAVAIDVALVTTESVAPILIAQQVQTAADAGAVQPTAATTVAVTDTTAVETDVAVTDPTAGQKAAVVEAPAAVQKTAEVAGPAFKQAVAETTGPVQAKTTEQAAATAQTVTAEGETATAKDTAQVNTTTQRSAAAQAQSQDLSQKVGPETKAQVNVTVTTHAAAQSAVTTNVYDIYAGYNTAQSSTANGQVGVNDAGNALVGSKTPAEAVQAQVASSASPALAPQPQTQASQQGTSSSAMRADFAAPSATHGSSAGNHNATSFGESAFGNTGTSHSNATTASTPATAAERPLATAQQVIDQIKVNITRAAKAGLDKVTIQLKPIELGRIDVQLEMSEDHKVRVTVTADNKDTLALLQNDARTLERTLNDAGLRTDANNLHFSLRSDSDAQNAGDGKNGGTNSKADAAGATTEDDDIAMTYDYAAAARVRGGIDTFA